MKEDYIDYQSDYNKNENRVF